MKAKIALLLLLSVLSVSISYGQRTKKKTVITGMVRDINQKPVSGAIVFIDNKKTEITTDEKGFYRIRVNNSAKSISVFTLMNGLSEAMIDGRTAINFTMKPSALKDGNNIQNQSNDETVNIGYGTVKRKEMTTQVGKVDGLKNKYAAYQNIYDMLRGEIPGVQVAGKSIMIQGPSSINLSNEPLLVVDGVIVNTVEDISPYMVKSIEVLKGSAASIYGSRGANGVILIYLRTGGEKVK